ncbi:MAG: RecX family transcriptional regulator, partial [Rhodobacteraceae bacterium]|nr:RecX family transcriptional regulator [Paracoccaceae bacterium]
MPGNTGTNAALAIYLTPNGPACRAVSPAHITPVIEHLQQNNYQSDQRYAECIVRHRVTK